MTWKLPLTSLSLIPYLSPITCPVSSTSEIYFESSYFCLFCHPLAPATTTYHSDSYCKHSLRYLQASLPALLQSILFGATTAILRKAKAPPCSHCTRESKGLAVASLVLLPFLQPHAVAHSQHSVWSHPHLGFHFGCPLHLECSSPSSSQGWFIHICEASPIISLMSLDRLSSIILLDVDPLPIDRWSPSI